jgi:hypothetical protein
MTAIETTGSGLIAALEQTWTDIRRRTPELPEVVAVTGTGLSSSSLHIDAKWGHLGADHWVEGRPTEDGQGAALDLSAARRKPELFVSGECVAEGPRQTLLHEAVHALAHVRGVKDTSRGGKYHNKREFVAIAGELGLAWPDDQRPHPVIGFSEVQLTEQSVADYADTLAYLGAAIRLYRDTFRRLGCSAAKTKGKTVRTATASSRPARPASGSRSPAAASRPGRSGSGPSSTARGQSPAASAARTSNPRTPTTSRKLDSHPGCPRHLRARLVTLPGRPGRG